MIFSDFVRKRLVIAYIYQRIELSFNLINILIMKSFFYNNQDPCYILPKETAICNLKWPTLKNRILHIILNKVNKNEFGKYSLIY